MDRAFVLAEATRLVRLHGTHAPEYVREWANSCAKDDLLKAVLERVSIEVQSQLASHSESGCAKS